MSRHWRTPHTDDALRAFELRALLVPLALAVAVLLVLSLVSGS